MNLLGTSALSAMQTAFKILAGFVLVKVVALAAGPEGVAQLGQFQNLVTVISILSGGMFYTGVTKLVAEYGSDNAKALIVIHAVLKASLLSFLCVVILVAIWHDEISVRVLKNGSLSGFVLILPLLAFPTVLYGLWLAVLNGFRRVRELVIASIASSVLMICLTIVLALRFGEVGSYISILLPPAVVLGAIFVRRLSKVEWRHFMSSAGQQFSLYRQLGKFALMGLVSAVAAPLAQMVMREYLVDELSLDQAGIWQGITRVSEVYLVFVTSSLSVYFLPKLAQAKGESELFSLVSSILKLTILASMFLGLLIYFFRDILIWLLFTPEFVSMRDLFLWQISGDMVKILSWVFAYIVLVRGTAPMFVVGEVVFNISYPILGMLLVPSFGLKGAVVAYGLNYIFYLVYMALMVFILNGKLRNSDV